MVDKKNLLTRTLTGSLFITVIIGSILAGKYVFFGLFCIICILSTIEFSHLTLKKSEKSYSPYKIVSALGAALMATLFFIYANIENSGWTFCIYLLFILFVFARELFLCENSFARIGPFLLGQITVALPFSLLFMNASLEGGIGSFSKELLLFFFAVIWINDSFAYIAGSAFGRHRMAEKISPKKSWEGFLGGLLITLSTVLLCYFVLYNKFSFVRQYNWYIWLLMAATIIVAGTFGDFLESYFKRSVGVKDSGRMLPGHGGLLDRFDSALMASPAIYIFLTFLQYF